jgi:putative DNA-invertase from lambdoid prophage Rac
MSAPAIRAALYVRVSTSDQSCELQIGELECFIAARGWENAGVYRDALSGAKVSRPGLDRLMADARLRKFDAVLCWKLDRFGRSLVHCVGTIKELAALGVRFIAVTQGLDSDKSNPTSALLMHILCAVAEFERELIRERVSAGMKTAAAKGTRSGKPIGRPRAIFSRDEALRLREAGWSLQRIGKALSVSLGTVHRTLAEQRSTGKPFQKAHG